MNPRTESMNGKQAHIPSQSDSKTIMSEALESADHLVGRVKSKTSELQQQAKSYLVTTEEYAKEHPWRVALTAVGLGLIAGAIFSRRKKMI